LGSWLHAIASKELEPELEEPHVFTNRIRARKSFVKYVEKDRYHTGDCTVPTTRPTTIKG
jgi:hypothetical protein